MDGKYGNFTGEVGGSSILFVLFCRVIDELFSSFIMVINDYSRYLSVKNKGDV